ncbi:MAG: TolC family protein [Gammaproteobacteria bacterium]|nr:TolC family protein [Gammaproteobacteria bacterium]MYF50375.1 TolC family protein [Gammaproteobacteria bacterium]
MLGRLGQGRCKRDLHHHGAQCRIATAGRRHGEQLRRQGQLRLRDRRGARHLQRLPRRACGGGDAGQLRRGAQYDELLSPPQTVAEATALAKAPSEAHGLAGIARPRVLAAGAVIGLLALLAATPSRSNSAAPESIDLTVREAIVLALRNSRALENARLDRTVERFALRIAEDEFRPRVTLDAYSDRYVTDSVDETAGVGSAIRLRIPTGGEFAITSRVANLGDAAPEFASHAGTVELTFVQPLLRGAGFGVARAALRTARVGELINVLAFEAAVIDLTSRTIRAYRAYAQAGRRDEIAARSLERAQKLLEVNQLLVQTGRMAERDVIQAEADIARRELDVVAARGGLDAARLNLVDLLDIDTGTGFKLVEKLGAGQTEAPSIDEPTALEIALANRTDYRIGLLGIENAETQVLVARNERLWDLSLTLGRTFMGSDDQPGAAIGGLDLTGNRVSLDLSVPVGRAAAGQAQLAHRRAVADLQAQRNRLDDLRQRIAIEVRNAVRDVQLAEQRIDLARRARSLALRKTEIEREKLNLGVTTNFQLVTFENDLVAAENAELDALVDHLNAATALDRTLGTTLERWGIEIDRVERSAGQAERFGVDGGSAPR